MLLDDAAVDNVDGDDEAAPAVDEPARPVPGNVIDAAFGADELEISLAIAEGKHDCD